MQVAASEQQESGGAEGSHYHLILPLWDSWIKPERDLHAPMRRVIVPPISGLVTRLPAMHPKVFATMSHQSNQNACEVRAWVGHTCQCGRTRVGHISFMFLSDRFLCVHKETKKERKKERLRWCDVTFNGGPVSGFDNQNRIFYW